VIEEIMDAEIFGSTGEKQDRREKEHLFGKAT
jgi:hypothetical protein